MWVDIYPAGGDWTTGDDDDMSGVPDGGDPDVEHAKKGRELRRRMRAKAKWLNSWLVCQHPSDKTQPSKAGWPVWCGNCGEEV